MEIKNVHTLEELREIFKDDKFAVEACGAEIVEADALYAKCEMELKPIHMNARGAVMGGAIFTLSDFAVAVAANGSREVPDTVAIDANISYIRSSKGKKLIAEAKCIKPGRIVSFYEVNVTDDLGVDIARFTSKTYTIYPKK